MRTIPPSQACSVCGEVKPADRFSSEPRKVSGLRSDCKDCRNAKSSAYRAANAEKMRARDAAYRAANAEAHRERARRDYWANHAARRESRKALRHMHLEKRREWDRKWRKANPEAARMAGRAIGASRRARQRMAVTFAVTPRDIARIRSMPCAVNGCDSTDIQVDHIVPLFRGGTHGVGNLQPLCARHNQMKGARLWIEFRVYMNRQTPIITK